jgi:uncharacterized membrane protein
MRTNQEYKNAALDRLRGNWKSPVLATLIYILIAFLIVGAMQFPALSPAWQDNLGMMGGFLGGAVLLEILIIYPLLVGYTNAIRLLYERRDYNVTGNMKDIATTNYGHKLGGMFLYGLKTTLWTLLFYIPGIIMSFAYAMTPYILEEHPEISAWDASTRSREMMKGHKFDLFYLYLSFIGWFILALLTAGIGFLWLSPYVDAAKAAFYNDLKAESGELTAAE